MVKITHWCLLAWLLCGGLCAQIPAASLPVMPSAWLEAKPVCVFPITCQALPPSLDLFTAALQAGLQTLAVPPPQSQLIHTIPGDYPALRRLQIDLSNAAEDDVHKPPKVNWHFLPQAGVRAEHFEVLARPLIVNGTKLDYDLTADGADLSMAQDRRRQPLLMLMGAHAGRMQVTAGLPAIQALCLAAARRFAAKYDFSVTGLSLSLTTPTDRSVQTELDVTLGGELGGTLHFTGRFNVADDLTATASDLTCHGEGPGGTLISGMLTPALYIYDGKTKPLVVFPFDGMRLRDVRFHMDGDLHVTAEFGDKAL